VDRKTSSYLMVATRYSDAISGTACGANKPSASNAAPTTPSAPASQANRTMLVITAAEASTMPI